VLSGQKLSTLDAYWRAKKNDENMHVRGFNEEGTTTAFDLVVAQQARSFLHGNGRD